MGQMETTYLNRVGEERKVHIDGAFDALALTIPPQNYDICREVFFSACLVSYERGRNHGIKELVEKIKTRAAGATGGK
jgi:hypothetical protein